MTEMTFAIGVDASCAIETSTVPVAVIPPEMSGLWCRLGSRGGPLMPTDPETALALGAAVQRVASWISAATPPAPADVVTIVRRLELAVHAEVVRAVRRVREEGQDWAVIAALLGLDDLPCAVADPAALAFDYCAGLARPPAFARPRFLWDCPACGQTIADHRPAGSPACSQQGHPDGCERLAAACAAWERRDAVPQARA